MTGTKQAKVTPVQRRQLGLVESLGDRKNRSIDEAYGDVGVTIADLPDPPIVLWKEVLDLECPGRDVVQKCDEDANAKPLANPVVDLDQYRPGHD